MDLYMKVKGGSTVSNGKAGNSVYDSEADYEDTVNFEEHEPVNEKVKTAKFEERLRDRRDIPISHLYEFPDLLSFNPFNFKSGRSKYKFYSFKKFKGGSLKNEMLFKKVKKLTKHRSLQSVWDNNKSDNSFRYMLMKHQVKKNLNRYFKVSMERFLFGGSDGLE